MQRPGGTNGPTYLTESMESSKGARAIVHFLGGETLPIPVNVVDQIIGGVAERRMTRLIVGTRVTWINPGAVAYIQMPSEGPRMHVG